MTAIFSGLELAEAVGLWTALRGAGFSLRQEHADEAWWAVAALPA